MYQVILYEDVHGQCPIEKFIHNLESESNKIKKSELKQVRYYIDILQRFGTRAGENFTKLIEGNIWELRPGKNRILFLMGEHNNIILLHVFKKKTKKTPKKEIEKAKREIKDWVEKNGYQ